MSFRRDSFPSCTEDTNKQASPCLRQRFGSLSVLSGAVAAELLLDNLPSGIHSMPSQGKSGPWKGGSWTAPGNSLPSISSSVKWECS